MPQLLNSNDANDFIEFIRNKSKDTLFGIGDSRANDTGGNYTIGGITVRNELFRGPVVYGVDFSNCEFIDFTFSGTEFLDCSFFNCSFLNCDISNTEFNTCVFSSCIFRDSTFLRLAFMHCTFETIEFSCEQSKRFSDIHEVDFFNCHVSGMHIMNSTIARSTIGMFTYNDHFAFRFESASIMSCKFSKANFNGIGFDNCMLADNSFICCLLTNEAFKTTDASSFSNSFIDLQTIIQSDVDDRIYRLFGIHASYPKDYIKDLVTEIKFQSVFISYSFEDRDFAHIINEQLRRHGVNTFLWERDAPGGKRLKKIMSENIRKHDRLLFIASQHSLQSEACQYELKEAREKQTHEWKDIYYPIHIDNYLFEVRKEDIPRKFREDFWENIEEVKEFHSKNFTKYRVAGSYDMKEFDEEVKKVIKDLKL